MIPLPQDACLPQLPVVLDAAAMAEAFAGVLRPHGMHVDACSVERVKYRPGRNATLSYRLSLRDGGGRAFDQHVAALLCGADGEQRAARAGLAAFERSQAGPALHWMQRLNLLTWWWPNDRKLGAARTLSDPAVLRAQVLPALMAVLGAPAADVDGCELEVMQYVPELRLCTRVDLRWHTGATAGAQRVYGKASREPGADVAHELLAQVQRSPAWREGRLHTPRALLWHAPTQTAWQEGLPGTPLLELPAEAQATATTALGEQLAALHGTSIRTTSELTPDNLRQRLTDVVAVLSPLLGSAPERAARVLLDAWPAWSGASTLHGDFHGHNILVEELPRGPQVALVDLDGLSRGPAVLELGAWIADAIYRALLDGAPAEREQPAWRALIEAYVDAGGARPDAGALRWSVAWQLLTQRAWRCVVNLKPGRYALAPRLVDLAADLAGGRTTECTP